MKVDILPVDEVYLNQFEQDLKDILYTIKTYYPNFKKSQEIFIKKVFWFACNAHKEDKRFSGEPYFTHPIAATKILLSIKPDVETVSACLLHDVIEDTPITAAEIEREFGKNIRFLCEGVEKITKVRLRGKEREYESIKKLFVAMAKDIRVIFIKLADRIHNLQTLEYVHPEKQIRISKESFKVYAPVASSLGLFEFKEQIEDICFSYLHPEIHKDLTQQIKQNKAERKVYIERAKKEIKKLLVKEKISFIEIQGRTKNIYSVYEKIKRKNFSDINEIYDLMAIRIIVNEIPDCYRTLGSLHSMWKPIPKRFKDYVAVPKPNGYQSLHTTVLGLAKRRLPTEVQIRTEQMHLDAEYGPAAHWAYKKIKSSNFDKNYLQKMNWIPKDIIFQQKQEASAEQFFEEISKSFASDRIHVFTPKGDIKTLPANATPVDFAFAIHSDIGKTCIGAKVNGAIKSLNHELKMGDIVDILTKEGKQMNPLWLNFVKSSHAKNHIKSYINTIKQEEKGSHTPFLKKVVEEKKPKLKKKAFTLKKASLKRATEVIIGGENNIPYKLGKCCHPASGKNIIAYNSRGLTFTIHDSDCKLLQKLDSARFVEATFCIRYHLQIEANDRVGILRDYANTISAHGINIVNSKFLYQEKEKIAIWKFTLEVNSEQEIQRLISDVRKIPNVTSIKEISRI